MVGRAFSRRAAAPDTRGRRLVQGEGFSGFSQMKKELRRASMSGGTPGNGSGGAAAVSVDSATVVRRTCRGSVVAAVGNAAEIAAKVASGH